MATCVGNIVLKYGVDLTSTGTKVILYLFRSGHILQESVGGKSYEQIYRQHK